MKSPKDNEFNVVAGRKLLSALAGEGAHAVPGEQGWLVVTRRKGVSLRTASAPDALVEALRLRGYVRYLPAARASRRAVITPMGQAFLGDASEAAGQPAAPVVNHGESPLAWLRSRQGRSGVPMIDEAQFLAGERLRHDITLAGLLPRVTGAWAPRVDGGADGLSPSDVRLAAQQRLAAAQRAIGPEFSGLLIDFCGFLKGLEEIETERQWPARSAKVVLRLALSALARHYRLGVQARGPQRSAGLRSWSGPGNIVHLLPPS